MDHDSDPSTPRAAFRILGVPIHRPSTMDLAITAALTVLAGIIAIALEWPPLLLVAIVVGWVLRDCGVSIFDHGWRAIVILLLVALVAGTLVSFLDAV